jgi:hypothetical protein
LDIVIPSWDSLAVFYGNGDGTFQNSTYYPWSNSGVFGLADLNGDGIVDIINAIYPGLGVQVSLGLTPTGAAMAGGSQQTAVLNSHFPQSLQVQVTGAGGFPVPGTTVLFTAPGAGASGSFTSGLTATVVTTDRNGFAVAPPFTANTVMGAYTVQAAVAGVSGSITFSLRNVAGANASVSLSTGGHVTPLGAPVNLAATVTPPSATGRVVFYDRGTILGSAPVNAGRATWSTALLQSGSHYLTARYSGDGNLTPATSTPLLHLIQAARGSGLRVGTNYPLGTTPTQAVVTDLNRDGHADLATSCMLNCNFAGVLLGKGDGAFQRMPDLSTSDSALNTRVADMNGDGIPDVIVNTGFRLNVFLGKGDGTYQLRPDGATVPAGNVVIADFNTDGIPDIAVAQLSQLTFYFGHGDGTFWVGSSYPATGQIYGMAVTDVNGDGYADLLVLNRFRTYPGHAVVVVVPGNGDGTFRPGTDYAVPFESSSLTLGDFNNDGRLDLVVSGWDGNVNLLLATAGSTFQAAAPIAAGYSPGWLAADLDGDGNLDLVEGNSTGLAIFYGKGDGTFQPVVNSSMPASSALGVGDFDGDGRTDIAVSGNAGLTVLLGTNPGPRPGDFDGNAVPDLVWQSDTTRQVTVNYYGGTQGASLIGWNWLNAAGAPGWRAGYR